MDNIILISKATQGLKFFFVCVSVVKESVVVYCSH